MFHRIALDVYRWSSYWHLNDSGRPARGQFIRANQVIGTLGLIPGLPQAKTHLHFEVRKEYLMPNAWFDYVRCNWLVREKYDDGLDFIKVMNREDF